MPILFQCAQHSIAEQCVSKLITDKIASEIESVCGGEGGDGH